MARFALGRGHIGLDVGTTAVRAVEIKGGERSPVVSRFGQVLLPQGAVSDGEVQDVAAVAEALTTLWKRAGFASRSVRIGVANRRVVVRQIEMPAMSRQDLEGAIRFQAQDYIPIPLPEAVMDFEVMDEFVGAEGDAHQRILVVAAERVMIDPLVQAVQSAKLDPQVVELNAYPLTRSLGAESAVAADAEVIIDVGGGVTNVVIHQGGKIRFTRILPSLGGDDFTQAISDALGLAWEDAEALKMRASEVLRRRGEPDADDAEEPAGVEDEAPTEEPEDAPFWVGGIGPSPQPDEETGVEEPPAGEPPELGTETVELEEPGPPTPDLDDAELVERTLDILESVSARFAGEIRGSVDFYTTQAGSLPLRAAVLTGGGSLLGGLIDQVGAALRIPAEPGSAFARVPVGKVGLSPEQIAVAEPFLAVAVGLALGGLES